MIKNAELLEHGFVLVDFPIELIVRDFVEQKNWLALDQYFLKISKPDGILRNFLAEYLDFETLEHIIAIRSAPDDEDGIWHDDGSRFLGFSLSLNLDHTNILGGELRFKKKESAQMEVFHPLAYGKIILFLSGIFGFEHMVSEVTKDQRIVIAGWCS
ncbi:MAG: 2OG-Fe(II) oxygenase [Bacteriovorax sp.]|nr:2OG-Fe(II) oxygenase [Bacteriovorax sp.]